MKSAFQKSWRETRRENRLITQMIIESEQPHPRPERAITYLIAGYRPEKRRAKLL